MSDKKISELPVAESILPIDIIPIVSGGANKRISAGLFALNLPNIGNKGITANLVVSAPEYDIPLNSTVIALTLSEHLLSGGNRSGQEITLVSLTDTIVTVGTAAITLGYKSTVTLVYIWEISEWVVKCSHNATFA